MMKLFKDCIYILFVVVVLSFTTTQASFCHNSVKFAHVSDIHFSTVREDNSYKLLSKTKPLLIDAVNTINKEPNVDFTIITGDGVDRPDKKQVIALLEILQTLKMPWYFTFGNHDTNPHGTINKTAFLKYLGEYNKNMPENSSYYSFKPKSGYKVIVLDGAREDKISSHGFISQKQLSWLDNTLKQSKKDVVLIFLHFPVVPPFDSPNHEILNVDDVKSVLEKYDMPIALFSGHYHMTKIVKRGNILHVSTPSLAGYPNAFRIVEVNKKRNKVIFTFDFKETNLKDLQAKTKIMTLGGSIYYGREHDRNTTVTIEY